MPCKKSGWHGERRRHSEAARGRRKMTFPKLIKEWNKKEPYYAKIFEKHSKGELGNDSFSQMEYKKAQKSWSNFLKKSGFLNMI